MLLLLRGTSLATEPRATLVLKTRTRLDPGVTPFPGSFRFWDLVVFLNFAALVQNIVNDNRELSGIVGLTHWADSYTFCLWLQFPPGLGASLDKLSPVKPRDTWRGLSFTRSADFLSRSSSKNFC